MGATFVVLGTSILTLLLAGYLAQRYLPPPKPRIAGIDLGTTYSCLGLYHAVSGTVDIIKVQGGHKCIPSVVAFSEDGILTGYKALAQAEHNPKNTLYDAKRFIGKHFSKEELLEVQKQYPFQLKSDEVGHVNFLVSVNGSDYSVTPEQVGSIIVQVLKEAAEHNISRSLTKVVMSVPAEFDDVQRNYTRKAGMLNGLEVMRIINEPTAAAMAYGLHREKKLQNIMVIDLGGGTLDVSLLNAQGGMFLTQAMAGNNHLGGQDFNQRLLQYLLDTVYRRYGQNLTDKENMQAMMLRVESVKLNLTYQKEANICIPLTSLPGQPVFHEMVSRATFEDINMDLFKKVLDPVQTVLEAIQMTKDKIDEIVLVGGSTRIPKVRELIRNYFQKDPNVSIDPELAVAIGVSIQAGIIGGMWPLTVSAVELPTTVMKIHIH